MTKLPTVTAKIFHDGQNQIIPLPRAFAFDTDIVTIEKQGDTLIVRPSSPQGWQRFFADGSLVLPQDFSVDDDPKS